MIVSRIVECDIFVVWQEKDSVKDKLGEARSSMRSLKENNESLHDLLAKVQDDKRRLGIRVNKLINNGNL